MSKLITPTAKQRVPLKVCHLYKCCVNCVHFICTGMSVPDGTCCKAGNKTNSARHCKNFEESRCRRPEVRHIKLPATEFKISAADFVTVNDVLEEPAKSLADILAEAYMKALKEDIKANTVIIDEHFAKVNAFDFVFGRDVLSLPPMICGLEIQVSDELPDGYDFAVLEVPETERDRLVRKAKAEAAVKIFEEIEEYTATWCGDYLISIEKLDELKKKYTEGREMIEMRNRLIDLLQENSYLDVLNDEHWLLAAEQLLTNGVIVPQVNVGDKLYYISGVGKIVENEVWYVGAFAKGTCYTEEGTPILTSVFLDCDANRHYYFTKEEAEKALAERRGE